MGIYTIENNSRHRRCAGVLLNSTTILTAAHCFLNINNLVVSIIRSTLLNNPVRVQVQISNNQVFLHPGYSTDEYINDFAIIKLNQKLDTTDEVLYPKFTESLDFEQFIFFGYGRDQNKKLDVLNKIFKSKNKILPSDSGRENALKFDQTDLVGISKGDSGGPVMAIYNGTTFLIAINGSAIGEQESIVGSDSSYVTKVSSVFDWIKSYM